MTKNFFRKKMTKELGTVRKKKRFKNASPNSIVFFNYCGAGEAITKHDILFAKLHFSRYICI